MVSLSCLTVPLFTDPARQPVANQLDEAFELDVLAADSYGVGELMHAGEIDRGKIAGQIDEAPIDRALAALQGLDRPAKTAPRECDGKTEFAVIGF